MKKRQIIIGFVIFLGLSGFLYFSMYNICSDKSDCSSKQYCSPLNHFENSYKEDGKYVKVETNLVTNYTMLAFLHPELMGKSITFEYYNDYKTFKDGNEILGVCRKEPIDWIDEPCGEIRRGAEIANGHFRPLTSATVNCY